jgi:hypothetical protein
MESITWRGGRASLGRQRGARLQGYAGEEIRSEIALECVVMGRYLPCVWAFELFESQAVLSAETAVLQEWGKRARRAKSSDRILSRRLSPI